MRAGRLIEQALSTDAPRVRRRRAIVLALTIGLASPHLFAQRAGTGPGRLEHGADLTGIWYRDDTDEPHKNWAFHVAPPPMTEWGMERFERAKPTSRFNLRSSRSFASLVLPPESGSA